MNAIPLALLLLVPHAADAGPGDHHRSLVVGGQKRTYHVHVPPSYDPKKPTPVVLALHGAAMNGRLMQLFSGLDRTADRAGFLAVYPDGTGAGGVFLVWNSGPFKGKTDDVAFLAAVLDDLAKAWNVDARRVYATGISNGGIMAYRLAAELSDRVAAIAPVAGTMVLFRCEPTRPVSVLHFHGTKDTLVPFAGWGAAGPKAKGFWPVEDAVARWAKLDGCKGEPETAEVADGKKDGLRVTCKAYRGGREGSEVVLYVIEGGGHTWPGRPAPVLLGPTTMSISANDLMWAFFRRHPKK